MEVRRDQALPQVCNLRLSQRPRPPTGLPWAPGANCALPVSYGPQVLLSATRGELSGSQAPVKLDILVRLPALRLRTYVSMLCW